VTRNEIDELIDVRLTGIRYAARDTHVFELRKADGAPFPEVDPGAHIDIHLPNNLIRQYSLLHAGPGLRVYSIAVKRDPNSRGGSVFMHEDLRVGAQLKISKPRNHFPLHLDGAANILLAGGIGITPIYCMANRLCELNKPWRLFYAAQTRADAAFLEELAQLKNVAFHFDNEQAGNLLDIEEIIREAPISSHFYCCGPTPMITAFETAARDVPSERVHVEHFTAASTPAVEGGFVVELARSKMEFSIPAGKTILEVLVAAGVQVPHSCESGVCGSCETRILMGQADHRDSILDERERSEGRTMMICCSGSKSERLILDL
jgi:tetrachlorobenzoquinone reductase